jgi:hypothetical protein
MSKFIEAVKSELLSGRKASFTPLSVTREIKNETSYSSDLVEYCIKVEWRQTGHCRRDDIVPMEKNAIHALRKTVYDDIEHRIIALERAIYEQDIDAVFSAIRDIKREIFS